MIDHDVNEKCVQKSVMSIVLLALFMANALADTIYYLPESGKPPKGGIKVSAETATTVTWAPEDSKSTKEESSFDIDYIEYTDASDEFKRGMGYFRKGSWYDAIKNLDTALKDARAPVEEDEIPLVRRFWVEQYALYAMAESHRQRGEKQADELKTATDLFGELLALTPPSRFTGNAMISLARIKSAQGVHAEGLALLEQVIDKVTKREFAPALAGEARLARAEINQQSGNAAGAASDFRQLADDLGASKPDLSMKYRLAAAFILLESGNDGSARSDFESIRKNFPDHGLAQAGANNGLGLIALKRKDGKEALETFATTISRFGSFSDEYDRALKGMADALRLLGAAYKGGDQLADDLIRELRFRNPTSPLLEGEVDTGEGRGHGEGNGADDE